MSKLLKLNKKQPLPSDDNAKLQTMRKRILWQAGLTVFVLVLTLVIVFAMTAAWTTNIVQTSGLQFQAEAWGYNRDITVVMNIISASPGDEGPVHLEVVNDNQDMAAVRVGVSKEKMAIDMQKRLYFYVDTQEVRNGETMDRVYLNTRDSYTYVLLSGQNLTLTEDSYNNAQLKWQWVYDVLGYYVYGMKVDGTVSPQEYLRPIEYIYDPMTVEFEKDANGVLTTLKSIGDQTAAEFLQELTAHDGYPGQIDGTVAPVGRYYPIEVDENGLGIYAYLCSYGEIESATAYDTALGADAKAAKEGTEVPRYEAILTISAENYQAIVENVTTLEDMNAAIAEGKANVIQLSEDIAFTGEQKLQIPANRTITLDLNGHVITNRTANTMIDVQQGASLTVLNGKMTSEDSGAKAIQAKGAEVTLSSVELSGFKQAVSIADHESEAGLDSKLYLNDCELNTTETTILVHGNGLRSEAKTQVVIENCKINSDGIAISGNGTSTGDGSWGTDIQIIQSEIISDHTKLGAGIYHPQKDSTLTIYNSTISGYTGMAIKGGTVQIVNSTIAGMGATANAPAFSDSGFADTADGIYIETNYGYEISLEISENSKINSSYGKSLQVFESTASHVEVRIISGRFKEPQPMEYIAAGSEQVGNEIKQKG